MNKPASIVKTCENAAIAESYHYFKHESGLDIYVLPKNHTSTYAMFGTKYGSIDSIFKLSNETGFTTVPDGIAHFLEHKLFEDEKGEDAFKKYAETGANANAYTSFDKTCYLFSCTANFEESLEILLDHVTHPYFSDKSVKKEQGIIGQEITMYEDNPGWQVFFGMLGALYSNHSVRLDIAGTIETISHITPEILYKCYNTFYNLNNMALCVTGDVTVEQVKKVADKVLKTAEPIKIERFVYDEPKSVAKTSVSKKLKVSNPLFNIAIKDNDVGYDGDAVAKKAAEIDIVNEMIFGKAGEFYSRLYNEGLINTKFGIGAECKKEYGFIEFSGESRDPEAVFAEIKKEIDKMRKSGLAEAEFERCKRVVYARSIKIFDNTQSISNNFMNCLFDGIDLLDVPSVIGAIKFEDAAKRFEMTYLTSNCVMSAIYPID